MPENESTAVNAGENNEQGTKVDADVKPWNGPQTQEEFDRIIQDRLARERSKFSDYEELKAKASELDELRDSEKSELERKDAEISSLRSKVEELESATARAEHEVLVAQVASEKGVPAHRIKGETREELEKDADAFLEEISGSRPKNSRVPGNWSHAAEPKTTQGSVESGRERAREYLGR